MIFKPRNPRTAPAWGEQLLVPTQLQIIEHEGQCLRLQKFLFIFRKYSRGCLLLDIKKQWGKTAMTELSRTPRISFPLYSKILSHTELQGWRREVSLMHDLALTLRVDDAEKLGSLPGGREGRDQEQTSMHFQYLARNFAGCSLRSTANNLCILSC